MHQHTLPLVLPSGQQQGAPKKVSLQWAAPAPSLRARLQLSKLQPSPESALTLIQVCGPVLTSGLHPQLSTVSA